MAASLADSVTLPLPLGARTQVYTHDTLHTYTYTLHSLHSAHSPV